MEKITREINGLTVEGTEEEWAIYDDESNYNNIYSGPALTINTSGNWYGPNWRDYSIAVSLPLGQKFRFTSNGVIY